MHQGSAYDGLLEAHGDDSHWAFGQDFEDPLAGVDTTLPDGVDGAALAAYCLGLGDDALVLAHRLSEWCSRAPDLEEDVAIANVALDLLGQARLLLSRAAAADPGVVPALPAGSPAPPEDALAFFRDADAFRCVRLVESDNGDFAETVARLLLFSTVRLAVLTRLRGSADPVLAAIAAKGVKELAYHRDWSARWVVTLAQGTDESRRRLLGGLERVWPLHLEQLAPDPSAPAGAGIDPADVVDEVEAVLAQVLDAAAVERPGGAPGHACRAEHTDALVRLLDEMQSVARAHPVGRW